MIIVRTIFDDFLKINVQKTTVTKCISRFLSQSVDSDKDCSIYSTHKDQSSAVDTLAAMSLFVASTCQILGDIIVNHVAWSKVDQIAALSAYTVDDNDRETNQVLFTNNEVILWLFSIFAFLAT